MENETGIEFIGTPKINEDIDFAISYYNITIDSFYSSGRPDNIRITKDHILSVPVGSSSRYINGKTNTSGSFSRIYEDNLFEANTSWDNYTNTIEDCILSFDESIVLFKGDYYEHNYYAWSLATALAEDYYIYDYIYMVSGQIGIAVSSAYIFSLETSRINVRYTTFNSYAYANYDGYVAGYDGIEKICCSPYGKFVCLYSISDYANYQDIIFTYNNTWQQIMTFNGMTLGNHYSVTSQEIRTEKAFSPDETLLIESLPDLGIVKVWEWDNTNSIWNQKGQTLMEQDYSQTYPSLIGDSYKNLNLGNETGFGRALEINISSDRIKIEDNNNNLYIFDMNELAPDTWNLQYTTNMVTEWESISYNTRNSPKEITLYGSNFFQNSIIIRPLKFAEIENETKQLPYIDLDIQLGIIPETINVYRSLYYYNQVDSSGNLIGDFTETSNDNTIISWDTNSIIHSWTDTNDSSGKLYTIQSEDWRYRLKVEVVYAGQTYIGYVNGINNKGIELPLSGYSMTDNTITSTSEDINVKIIFVSLEGDYYKIDFEDNIFDYNLLTFYDSNETNYSLTQINNRDIYVPDSYNINDGIISSDNTIQKQFQWFRNGVAITTIQDYNDTIDTGYTLTVDDMGQTITVKLIYSEEEFENNGIDLSDTVIVDSNINNIDFDLRTNTKIYLTGIENTVSFLSNPTISVDSNIITTGDLQILTESVLLNITPYDLLPPSESEGVYNQFGRIFYYNTDIQNSGAYNGANNKRGISNTEGDDTVIDWRVQPRNIAISGNEQIFAVSFFKEALSFTLFYNKNDMKAFSWIEDPNNNKNSYIGNRTKLSYDGEYFLTCAYSSTLYNYYIEGDMQFRSSASTSTGFVWLYRKNSSTNIYELYKYDFHKKMVEANNTGTTGIQDTYIRIYTCDMSDDAQFIIVGASYLAALFQWNDGTEDYDIVKLIPYTEIIGTAGTGNSSTRFAEINSDGTMFVIKGTGDERYSPMTVYEWTGNFTSNIGSNPKRDDFVQIFQETDPDMQITTGYPTIKGNFIGINGSNSDYLIIYEYTPRDGDAQGSVVRRGSKIYYATFPEINERFVDQEVSFDIKNDGMIVAGTSFNNYVYIFKYSEEIEDWSLELTLYDEIQGKTGNLAVVRLFEDGTVLTGGFIGVDWIVNYNRHTNYLTVNYGLVADSTDSGGNIGYTPGITNGVDTPRFLFSDSTTNLVVQKDFNISVFTSTAPIADTNDTQLETRMTVGKTPPSLIINPYDYFTDADLSDQFQTDSLSFSVPISVLNFNKINVRRISSNSYGQNWILYAELQVWINNQNIIQTDGATASYKSGDNGYNQTPASNVINNDISDRAITDSSNTLDNDYCILVTLNQTYDISQVQSIVLYQSDSRIEGCVIELFDNEELIYTTDALPLHPANASNYTDGANHSIRLDGSIDFSSITTTDVSEFATKIINNSTSTLIYDLPLTSLSRGTVDIDSNTFEIAYTPNADLTVDTSDQLIIIATDKYGLTDEKTISINILINYAPTFVGPSTTLNMYKLENLSETFTIHCLTLFTDTANDSLTFSVDSSVGLQYGSIVIDNDRILYTADSNINTETTDTIQITATDTLNESVTQLFNIVIGIALDNTTTAAVGVPKYPKLSQSTDTNLYDFSVKHTPGVETHLVLDSMNYFFEQNDNDYSLTISGTGTYGRIDRTPLSEPTFTKNRPTGSFSSFLPSNSGVAFQPYARIYSRPIIDGHRMTFNTVYPLVTSLTFNEENNFRQGPFYIKPQARLYDVADNLSISFNLTNFPIGINGDYGVFQRIWIVQKPDGTYTLMSQNELTEYYLTSDLNMSTSDIENSLSLTIESNLNGSFSFIPSTSPTQYLVSNNNNISFGIGDATYENHGSDQELFQQNYMLYDAEIYNKIRYIVNDDVTGNVQDQVTLIATNEWNLTSYVTININIETVSSPLPSTFDITQYIGETNEIVTIENISDYFLDSNMTISAFHYRFNKNEETSDITITDNILAYTINSTYMIKSVIVELIAYIDYGNAAINGNYYFDDSIYTNYRIEKKFDINVELTDIIATVDSNDVTISLNKAQGYEQTVLISNISNYFIPVNSSDTMTYTATSQFGEITIDTDLNLTCTYNENIIEDTIDEIVIQMTNQDNYFARKTINIDIQFYIPENMQVQGGTSEILLSTLFPDTYFDPEASLIAHYEFNDSNNIGKCSINSANDLINSGSVAISSDAKYDMSADFTSDSVLYTNNIELANSTHTISFWAKSLLTDNYTFFYQGETDWNNALWYFASGIQGNLTIRSEGSYFATDDAGLGEEGNGYGLYNNWHMHTIVIRSDGIKRIYIDGRLEGETVISSTEESTSSTDGINHPTFTTENQPLIISGIRTTSGYSHYFNGYMDDFRVYDIELSAKEISYLFGVQKPRAIIDSNFGLQYGNAVVDEDISKIVYTADSNLDGISFNDAFKVEIEEHVLIAHYEFNDPSNVGKCSVNSANDLILFGGANIVTNTLSDTTLSSQNVADFTGNNGSNALITKNINLGNSTHTISFWAKQPGQDQCIFFAQGHYTDSWTFYGSSGSGKLYLKTNYTTLYPATDDTNITITGASIYDALSLVGSWHMHTLVIRDDGVKKLYIDGQFYSSTETANVTNAIFTNENKGYLTIGGLLETASNISNPTEEDLTAHTSNDYEGYMQDLRIYNSELSEENINDLYNSTVEVFLGQEKIVTVDITTDEPPTADTNETIFTIGQTIGDESIATTVDVTLYFTDNGPLTYSVDTNYGAITGTYVFENNNIIYTTDSNMTEDVVDQINIIAQDEVGQTVEKVFTFNIIANNKPVADTNVLSYNIYDLTIPVIVDVTDIFSDIDSGDILTVTIDTTYGLTNGTAVIADNNLSYLASVDIKDNRTDEVKLIVTDSFNATAEKILNINISPIIVQSDVNIVVYKNTPKVLNLGDYITSGNLLSSTVDETYGLVNGFIKTDSNAPDFSEYNPKLNVIGSDSYKIILNSTIELIINIQMESGIIEANFVEGDTNLIIEVVQGEDPKVDLSQFVSNPAEKPLEIEITQDVLEQVKGEIIIDSNTNEITYVPEDNVSGPQTIIFEVKIFD